MRAIDLTNSKLLIVKSKQGVAEGKSTDTAISLSRLGKFHAGEDTLAEFVPERATAQYALHPDKWESTFYSLTNKDSDKLRYYGPKKIAIPPGTLVGDMAIANKFYRAKTTDEKQLYAKLYRQSLKPYPVDVNQYRMPELLMPRQGVAEGAMKDFDIDLQDQRWDAIVGYVINGLKKNMDIGRMELNLYKYAGQEMFDVDQELENRGFKDIADLADHILQHNGRYVPPTNFDLKESQLITDVPNEEWLQGKIDYVKSRGRDRYGVPYTSATTAVVKPYIRLPVDLLKRLPGMRGEQSNVRYDDLKAIMKIMKDTGKLPLTDSGKEYAPFVVVAHNGEAWVSEGNHRIMAADKLGWDTLPVELKYFDGGERIKSGMLYPPKIGLAAPTIDEMALSTYKTMGDFNKPGPFRGADKKLVPHEKNIQKATKFFQQTPYDFRLFFSNITGTGKYSEYGPMDPNTVEIIFGEQGKEIVKDHNNAITVVFVGNTGADKKMLTPWLMAHRFGHAIAAENRGLNKINAWKRAENHFFTTINKLLDTHYGKIGKPGGNLKRELTPEYNALFNAIGTQRSSRSGQIKRPYEFLYELFAQYLGTGKIELNPLPTNLGYGRKVWGNPTRYLNIKREYNNEEDRKQITDTLAYDMELMFNDVLSSSVGKIYIM